MDFLSSEKKSVGNELFEEVNQSVVSFIFGTIQLWDTECVVIFT